MNDIVMVNDANVESVIAADKPVILAIGASWCPDCRRAQPFFTQLAAVNAERAVFASCDSEQNPQVVAKYAATSDARTSPSQDLPIRDIFLRHPQDKTSAGAFLSEKFVALT